ncbi:DUF1749 domain-containing protein [Candidatus Roizmanbacteria bacterium]|nr:DUF1749 domain-containing protein [Candidatus Roizmanbacteria bacterium]
MQPEFVTISTADGLTLPGLWYSKNGFKKAAIWLHGMGSSVFYSSKYQVIAEELEKKGIALLAFNNRGAMSYFHLDVIKKGEEPTRKTFGMSHEIIKECIEDIEGAIAFLKEQGCEELYLIGHSTGANKICVYDHYRPENPISKYVLLGGGDDTGMYYYELGEEKHAQLLKKAKQKIGDGQGEMFIPELLEQNSIYSYQAFYDIANPDGDYNMFPFYEEMNSVKLSSKPLFGYFAAIKKPSFVIYGGNDEYAWGDVPRAVNILKKYNPKRDYSIIENADHGFSGHIEELAKDITDWL